MLADPLPEQAKGLVTGSTIPNEPNDVRLGRLAFNPQHLLAIVQQKLVSVEDGRNDQKG